MGSDAVVAAIREAFGRVVWTHKTHEKAIDRLNSRVYRLRLANVILLVATTGGVVTSIFGTSKIVDVGTAVLSALALGLAVYQFSFDPMKPISDHRKASKNLWYIRERYIHLLADVKDGSVSEDQIRTSRDALAAELAALYDEAPDTDGKAYVAASRALKVHQEMTFSDSEIDQFLPRELRKVP